MKEFTYKIAEIETESFVTNYKVFDFESKANSYNLRTQYSVDDESNTVILNHTISFFQIDDQPFMELKVNFIFALIQESWDDLIVDANTLVIPLPVAQLFNNISLGTCRGIIHAKTENSPLNKIILPPIILENIIKEDVTFDMSSSS